MKRISDTQLLSISDSHLRLDTSPTRAGGSNIAGRRADRAAVVAALTAKGLSLGTRFSMGQQKQAAAALSKARAALGDMKLIYVELDLVETALLCI